MCSMTNECHGQISLGNAELKLNRYHHYGTAQIVKLSEAGLYGLSTLICFHPASAPWSLFWGLLVQNAS